MAVIRVIECFIGNSTAKKVEDYSAYWEARYYLKKMVDSLVEQAAQDSERADVLYSCGDIRGLRKRIRSLDPWYRANPNHIAGVIDQYIMIPGCPTEGLTTWDEEEARYGRKYMVYLNLLLHVGRRGYTYLRREAFRRGYFRDIPHYLLKHDDIAYAKSVNNRCVPTA